MDATVLSRSRTTHRTTNNRLFDVDNDQAVASIPKGTESRLIPTATPVTPRDNQEGTSVSHPYILDSDENMPSKDDDEQMYDCMCSYSERNTGIFQEIFNVDTGG